MNPTYRIVFDCPDQVGIVTRVGDFISQHGGWISDAVHHSDSDSRRFFSRIVVNANSLEFGIEDLRDKFSVIAEQLSMNWKVVDSQAPKRVVVMVSKGSHCLTDLFDRMRYKEFNCEIACVISNHEDMRGVTEFYGYDYHCVPIDKDHKQAGFTEVERLVENYDADTIVLARYMQIVPPALCEKYQHQIINIHHSFLPSFIGAKPYHQAHQRGVKLIGATCHYVTQQLDEGPIIEQGIQRVSHSHTVEDLVRLGRDVEKTVLAKGLRAHLEDRVMVHKNSTVVLG
ncbi:formyltetrahydrofolate deformylase [Arenicella sp. 4NH20-0111]|uniref:formyltetrahydrofolate deformylase n=1 Tax=Arenicella sp. 4NH20-0111 TaxID=3127648 RepID=UPI0031057AC7